MKTRAARGWWMVVATGATALVVGVGWWPRAVRADWRSLTGPLPAYVDRVDYQISPDSKTVAFTADIDTDNLTELYAEPITGTHPIKLNPPLVKDGTVDTFIFTPDGKSIIYRAVQEVANRRELYIVPVGGGQATKLNGPLVAGGDVREFEVDSKHGLVFYIADEETNEQFDLWAVPLTGGTPTRIDQLGVAGADVSDFELDPSSNRVVYLGNQETGTLRELFSVPVTGGTPVKLNPPIKATLPGDGGIDEAFVDPGGPVVLFSAREAATANPGGPGGTVYMIPTVGGVAPTALSFHMNPDQRILSFFLSPTGGDVIFDVGQDILTPQTRYAFAGSLYRNLVGGGGAANVTETADPTFGASLSEYHFLPDGSRVVYSFQNNASTAPRLESATMLGVRTKLYDPGTQGPQLTFFRFSPDSQWVMYQTKDAQGNSDGMYTIPPTGGQPTGFGNVTFQAFTPDSSRVLYTRVVSDTFLYDLFSAQSFGGDERNLSKLDPLGFVGDTQVSPDGKWIVFLTQINGQDELRVSDGAEAQASTPTPTVTPTSTSTSTVTLTPTPTLTPQASTTPDQFEEHLPALGK